MHTITINISHHDPIELKISHESEHHLIKADQSGYIVIRGVKP